MTNAQAQAYAVIALKGLIEDGVVKVKDTTNACHALDHEMHRLFDTWEEEIVEKIAIRILEGR